MAERPAREIGVWPLVIGAAVIILAAVFFFTRGEVPEPTPLPDSPAATGTAGQPVGTTGPEPQPGAPAGAEVPAGTPTVTPSPDAAPSN